MSEYKAVRSTLEISRRIVFYLDTFDPQHFTGTSHAEAVRNINDILQGRSERTVEMLLGELRQKGPGLADHAEQLGRELQDFHAQKELLKQPYQGHSGKKYRFGTYDGDPEYPLKIIDQQLFDRAVKDGFPPDFFHKSYFDGVTLYCMPDGTDLSFSEFHGCTFAVCRIHGAIFDGSRLYQCKFHSCDVFSSTFFAATFAHTHFYDSTFSLISLQRARLAHCNTIDCKIDRVSFLNTTLDGCFYGRVTPSNIQYLHTATITQGGATTKECRENRAAIYKALAVSDLKPPLPAKCKQHPGPER